MARVAYADPPYVGQAERHYTDDPSGIAPAEVDHAALIARLESEYDGWALSCSCNSLGRILAIVDALCVPYRIGAWCKPFAGYKTCNPSYSWEPVILRQPRKANYPSTRDYVLTNMTTQTGTHGAKPEGFSFWLFDAMNMVRDDELVDIFPGSGAVSAAWRIWQRQAPTTRRKKGQRPAKPQLWDEPA